ncbi:syntaxin isoform X3 [Nilaparvata lugens]|uniref:syntaxin isoform X1 n=1 Tax=Nilaparvata lugens TaxID=108931 RepID=UPI00193EA31C|nr:syntaxin isoform X1 [Nilaparvata lugens]XP_039292788.1 syntaxin isoform X3 [Nilaparvata lugens]
MTRDRIEELRAVRNGETSQLLGNGRDEGHLKIEIASNTSKYSVTPTVKSQDRKENKELDNVYKKVQQIKDLIQKIEDETIELRRIQDSSLKTVIATKSEEHKTRLDASMLTIRGASKEARRAIQELQAIQDGGAGTKMAAGPLTKRVLGTQLPMINRQYLNAMQQYQDALVAYKDKTETMIKKQLTIVVESVIGRRPPLVPVAANHKLTNEELEELFDKQDTSVFVENYIQKTMEARQNLQDIRDRHQELMNLEKSIIELHEMFGDVAILVENQGEMIDRVESYVGNGVELVKKGQIELTEAERSQKRARKKKMMLIICLISVLAIFIIGSAVYTYLVSLAGGT